MFPEQNILDPQINITTIKRPEDIFNLYVSDEILEIIAHETNIYASQHINKGHRHKSRVTAWTETDKDEIRNFFGILVAMGLCSVPSINLYWSKDTLFHNTFISSVMTRDRFLLLLKFIHFANNEHANNNKLYKIEHVLSLLLKNYQAVFKPGRILVIDESMIPFRGRLHFKQYIPNKTHKYGVKLYNVKVYTGKGDTNPDLGHSQSIVLQLLDSIDPKEGRILFADNFYSSIELTRRLYEMKILYCGTLRSNRKGVPKNFGGKMRKGQVYGKENNNVKIIKWVDKRPVLMISSDPHHNATLVSTNKVNRQGEEICKPQCVIDYNKAKKGVDYSDQMSSYHTVIRKSLKWYRKVLFELLLGTTVVNAWIVYNMTANTKLGITEFRRQLAEDLINSQPKIRNDESKRDAPKRRLHTFVKPDGPGRKKRKVCRGCYNKLRATLTSREADRKVKRVISFCKECPGAPGLCLDCFNKCHQT